MVQGPPLPYRPFVRLEHLPGLRSRRSLRVDYAANYWVLRAHAPASQAVRDYSVIVAWTALSPRGDSRVSFSKRRQLLTSVHLPTGVSTRPSMS